MGGVVGKISGWFGGLGVYAAPPAGNVVASWKFAMAAAPLISRRTLIDSGEAKPAC